jgi:exosortase
METIAKNIEGSDSSTLHYRGAFHRAIGFFLICTIPICFVWAPLKTLSALVFRDDTFAYIPLIPIVSLYFVFVERRSIFAKVSYDWVIGSALIVPGSIGLVWARLNPWHLSSHNQGSLLMFALVLLWTGTFALFFGKQSFRKAFFPLLFLLFMIPIPEPLLSQTVFLLQQGSAKSAEWIFDLFGVPYLRQGLEFNLPGVSIFVAEECSGIRSSLALLITTVLASHLFLRKTWNKLVLCAVVVPMAILKNGLRIATLSTLAVYVNPGFLTGRLHHQGGIVFFIMGLLPIGLLLVLLQKIEKRTPGVPRNS